MRVIILTTSRGEFLTTFAFKRDKKGELTTSAFCFRVQQTYDRINLEESAAFNLK